MNYPTPRPLHHHQPHFNIKNITAIIYWALTTQFIKSSQQFHAIGEGNLPKNQPYQINSVGSQTSAVLAIDTQEHSSSAHIASRITEFLLRESWTITIKTMAIYPLSRYNLILTFPSKTGFIKLWKHFCMSQYEADWLEHKIHIWFF